MIEPREAIGWVMDSEVGSEELVHRLSISGIDPRMPIADDGYTLLHACAEADWNETELRKTSAILALGGRVDAEWSGAFRPRWRPIHVAVYEGEWGKVRTLVRADADLEARCGGGETVLELLVAGASVSKTKTLISIVERRGRLARAECLDLIELSDQHERWQGDIRSPQMTRANRDRRLMRRFLMACAER